MEENVKTIDLSQHERGDVFKTKGGAKVKFWYIDYGVYRLYDNENSDKVYSYSKDGTCEALGDEGTLIEFLVEESNANKSKEDTVVTDVWSMAVKVISSFAFLISIIVGIVMCGEDEVGMGTMIIASGLIQFLLNFMIANLSGNVKKSTAIQEEILKELKEQNKQKGGN